MRCARPLTCCSLMLGLLGSGPRPLFSQVVYGSDVTWHSQYEWRGLTLRDGMVLQPDVFLSVGAPLSVTVGGWTNVELTTPGLSGVGYDKTLFGETNVWAETSLASSVVDLAVGWNWYRFDAQRIGRVPARPISTHEVYGRMQFSNLPVFVPRIEYFHDVDEVRGGFAEASLTIRVPIWTRVKLPVGSLLLTGTTGYNFNQDSLAGIERFQDRGFKYVDVAASTVIGYMPISVFDAIFANIAWSIGLHLQFNLDPTTKRVAAGNERARDVRFTVGFQWFGPRCEPRKRIC